MRNGSIVKAGILSGVLFGVAMGGFYLSMAPLATAAAVGAASGAVFGAIMAGVMALLARRTARNRPDLAGEAVLHEGLANHRKGIEACGGWLFLTGRRLHFKSHRFNVQSHELSIPLDEVSGAEAGRSLGLIPNRLVVTLRNGARESFVVQGAKAWARAIGAAQRPAGA